MWIEGVHFWLGLTAVGMITFLAETDRGRNGTAARVFFLKKASFFVVVVGCG